MESSVGRSTSVAERTSTELVARSLVTVVIVLLSACASIPSHRETRQVVRIENQTFYQIRTYVAFETSPEVRVLLGTLEANRSEFFSLPGVFDGCCALVITCEKGRPVGAGKEAEMFQTSAVALTPASILVVRVRYPIRYSDYTLLCGD